MFRSEGSPRARGIALVAMVVALASVACAGRGADQETSMGRAAFGQAVQDRYGIDDTQADCITRYVFEDYDASEIRVLADAGMAALPQARWEPYLNATVACITHDEPLEGGS